MEEVKGKRIKNPITPSSVLLGISIRFVEPKQNNILTNMIGMNSDQVHTQFACQYMNAKCKHVEEEAM